MEEFRRKGFSFVRNIGDGVLPDWYQTNLQTVGFIASQLPPDMAVIEHAEKGHTNWQDRALIRKGVAPAA